MIRSYININPSKLNSLIVRVNLKRILYHSSTRRTSTPPDLKANDSSPVSYTSFGLTAIAALGVLIYYNIEKEKRMEKVVGEVIHVGKPAIGGPWSLVDHNGVPRTDAFYHGQFQLLYFGFSYCPDICPSELVKIGKILSLAEKRHIEPKIKPVFITVDPNRDTVGQLRHYRKDFHPDIDFYTGTPAQITAVTKAFRVYYNKANENEDDANDYLVDHSIVLYLISPDGEFLDFFTQKMQVNDIVDRIEKYAAMNKSDKKKMDAAEAKQS